MAKKRNISIPYSVLANRSLSILEVISKYLKDKKKLTYHEIAVLLNRDDRTIWTCYDRAIKKNINKIISKKKGIPAKVLRDRSVSVLEAIVRHLKDKKKLTYHEIAVLLNRDDRTIWTVYSRARKKNAK